MNERPSQTSAPPLGTASGIGAKQPRWDRIFVFLALVFSLSWGSVFLFEALSRGSGARCDLVPPLGMFVPALVAICLRVGFFRESPVNRHNHSERPRWIFRGFVLLFLLQVSVAVLAVASSLPGWLLRGLSTWSMIGWTLLVIRLYRRHGEEGFDRAGLRLGNRSIGLKIAIGVVAFLVLQGVLDLTLGIGRPVLGTVAGAVEGIPEWFEPVFLVIVFALSIVGTPLGSLAILFGEEYGWRGFLQDELESVGRRKAALAIGLIWGIWHVPIILRGVHTYPPTAQGFVLAAVFFSLWGFVQSYAVFKTGSVWTAAVLHGIVNGLYWFLRTFVVRPDDKILSFGLGLYGAICLAVVVLFLSRDPIWDAGAEEVENVHVTHGAGVRVADTASGVNKGVGRSGFGVREDP